VRLSDVTARAGGSRALLEALATEWRGSRDDGMAMTHQRGAALRIFV
jgi:hypothetical protein